MKVQFGKQREETGARRDRVGAGRSRLVAGVGGVVATGALVAGLIGPAAAGANAARHTAPRRSGSHTSVTIKHGGSLTVLEWSGFSGSWPGLDPATDTNGAADQSYMNAIFGQLFELGTGGKLVPDLATAYKYSNGGKTITLTLRKGVTFSDGTSFNSSAVVANWQRDLASSCSCKPTFNQTTTPVVKAVGPYGVSITLSYVDASFINGLQDDIFNWIASPTALKKMGATAFALKPVGAGPFTVVSDTPSTVLELKANPRYWEKGHPYLSHLTFKAVANDEAAYEAMLAGSGQAYENMSTPALAKPFKAHFQLTTEPSTSPYDIQLNTAIAPFNNVKAREAVYYATNCQVLDAKLFGNQTACGESFTAPGGLFYQQKVPGYLGYDLAKAKKLVKAVGGISVQLFTIQNPNALNLVEALQTMWQQAGMKVSIVEYDLSSLIGKFVGKKWQVALQTAGAYDPATGVGVAFRFASTSPFSGVHDPHLDALLAKASGVINPSTRTKYYAAAAAYIAKNAYGPFLFPINGYDAAAHGVGGPGLSTPLPSVAVTPSILWEDVYNNN